MKYLDLLTPRQREIWIAMHGLGSRKAVAEYLGVTVSTVSEALINADLKITAAEVEGWDSGAYGQFTKTPAKKGPHAPGGRFKDED